MKYNRKQFYFSTVFSLLTGGILAVILGWILHNETQSWGWSLSASILFFISLFLYMMRKYLRRKKLSMESFPEEWDQYFMDRVEYYNALNEEEKKDFQEAVIIFLNEVNINGIDTKVDDEIRLLVAASAIIPVMQYPEWEYHNLSEVLIYPGPFDEKFDVSNTHSHFLGMVGIGRSMVISKPALVSGFANADDKHNVGFHEFAHLIDENDGVIDGLPHTLIPKNQRKSFLKKWNETVDREMNDMKRGKSDIDRYGLTNRAEFFAVASEYFFENPEAMKRKHSELYQLLKVLYRQDAFNILKTVVKSWFKP